MPTEAGSRWGLRTILIVGSFAVLAAMNGAAFAITEAGHVAMFQSDDLRAVPFDQTFQSGEPPSIRVQFHIDNPTWRHIEITNPQQLVLQKDDEPISTERVGRFNTQTLPAKGEITIDIRFHIDSNTGTDSDVKQSLAEGRITVLGSFVGYINEARIKIHVTPRGNTPP